MKHHIQPIRFFVLMGFISLLFGFAISLATIYYQLDQYDKTQSHNDNYLHTYNSLLKMKDFSERLLTSNDFHRTINLWKDSIQIFKKNLANLRQDIHFSQSKQTPEILRIWSILEEENNNILKAVKSSHFSKSKTIDLPLLRRLGESFKSSKTSEEYSKVSSLVNLIYYLIQYQGFLLDEFNKQNEIHHIDVSNSFKDIRNILYIAPIIIFLFALGLALGFYRWVSRTENRLYETEQILEEQQEHLEDLVEERTRELSYQQLFNKAVLDNINDGIVACDANGTLSLFNQATREMHGIDQEDLSPEQWSKHYRLFLADGQTPMPFEDIPLFLAYNGKKIRNNEFVIEHVNGQKRTLIAAGQPMYDELGNKLGAVVSMHDITRHKEYEMALIKAKEEAETANKSKSQFLANMSHELRTPMHSVISFANLGLKRVEDKKIEHYLQNIRTSGIRLTMLLNDLLDLSKLEAGKMQVEFIEQDLVILIKQALAEIDSLLSDKNISIEFDTDNSINCMIDQKLMTQVIVNLLSNAIKFSPENSVINIDIQIIKYPFDKKPQDIIKLSFADQGVGIPPDEIETVFDKFTQSTKTISNAGGTGLGLPITKEIINLHHGEIHAESPPPGEENGSAFIIEIPALQVATDMPEPDNIQDAIDLHINWKNHVDEIIDKRKVPYELPVSLISNEYLCGLGMWLNSNETNDTDFFQLKQVHKDFHHHASECIAYCQINDIKNAMESKEKYDKLSQEIIRLAKKLGSLK